MRIFTFIMLLLCADILQSDSLTVELCNKANNHATNGVWFGTNYMPDGLFILPAQYSRLTCSVDSPEQSWNIRIYTRNTNYSGPGSKAGLVNLADSTRKLPLFWRVYDLPLTNEAPVSNTNGWGLMSDSEDAGWADSYSASELARGEMPGVLLAPYPVSNRVIPLSNSLYIYFAADVRETLLRNMNGTYGTTVCVDLNRYLPPVLSLDSIDPDKGYSSDRKAELILFGKNFQKGAVAKLTRPGQSDISGEVIEYSTNRLLCRFDLTRCLLTGYYDLAVVNPGGEDAVLPGAFRVLGYDMTGNRLVPVNNFYLARPGGFVNIKWNTASAGKIFLKIVNTAGEVVKSIMDNITLEAGSYQFDWDGTNDKGKKVASGIYFVMMKTDGFSDMKKIVVVR